ncbi:unnamed protein product [Cladocopium goreaui]|uniref:DNA (Cytosine-5-)-methyltransferase n=1 Tax=Cladocopium goreaui TaxID=2562237 RepID=A0A9P1CJY9_9DINO|nr:unnamed protein product [Cladocopium goreaui]
MGGRGKTVAKAKPEPKLPARGPKKTAKQQPSISPLLDAENEAAVATSGAEYNLDLITAANRALAELAEINWPGVGSEDPVALGSMYRDNNDEEKLSKWKHFALSVEFEYFIATNDEDIYFMAMNLRQDLLADREAMVHTTLQKVISVLHCKQRMERVTESFVETAVAMSKKILAHKHLMELYDGWKNGHLGADMLTWRGINNALHGKGTCDLFVGQLELREYLFAKVIPKCGYMGEKVDLTWRAGWPKSAELFWAFLEASEWVTNGEVENRLDTIKEQVAKEKKASKSNNDEKNDDTGDDDDVVMQDVPGTNAEEEEDESGTGHLKVQTQGMQYGENPRDTKVCGEAGTQPALRLPPLREGRHPRLFQAALSLRQENGSMLPGDKVETWSAPFVLKKEIYGKGNRIGVGGKGEELEGLQKGSRRKDDDIEPVAYHALPSKVGYLMKWLETKCWGAMYDPESPLYEPTLSALLRKKSSNNKKAQSPNLSEAEAYYMSESDPALRERIRKLYRPKKLSKVMDCFQYGGLPQRRPRLWIVGLNKYAVKRKFKWPKPLKKFRKVKLSDFLGRKSDDFQFPTSQGGRKRLRAGLKRIINEYQGDTDDCWVVDCAASKKFAGKPAFEMSPCLTRTRSGGDSFWITSHRRFLNLQEKAKLQGWSSCRTEDLSERQFALALGNAWPRPVAERIIVALNKCMGWMPELADPYL